MSQTHPGQPHRRLHFTFCILVVKQMGSGSHFTLLTLHHPHFFADANTFLSTENRKKNHRLLLDFKKTTIHDVVMQWKVKSALTFDTTLIWDEFTQHSITGPVTHLGINKRKWRYAMASRDLWPQIFKIIKHRSC